MISFFNLHELFSASICADNIEGLLNNLFRFKMFYLVPVAFLFLSAIVFFGSNSTSSSPSNASISGKSSSSKCKLVGQFSDAYWIFMLFFWAFVSVSFWTLYIFRSFLDNSISLLSTTFLFSKSFILSSLIGLISFVSN